MRIWNVEDRRSLTSHWLTNVYFIIFMLEFFIVFMTIVVSTSRDGSLAPPFSKPSESEPGGRRCSRTSSERGPLRGWSVEIRTRKVTTANRRRRDQLDWRGRCCRSRSMGRRVQDNSRSTPQSRASGNRSQSRRSRTASQCIRHQEHQRARTTGLGSRSKPIRLRGFGPEFS